MKKKSSNCQSLGSKIDTTIQAAAGTSPDGRMGARASVRRAAGRTRGEGVKGSTPTNRAPYNCNNNYFKLLRFGVDAL